MKTTILKQNMLKWISCLMLSACASIGVEAANKPDPAAVFCSERGHRYDIRKGETGKEYGVCIFSGGSQCDAWDFYRGECRPDQNFSEPQPTDTVLTVPVETANLSDKTYQDDEYRVAVPYICTLPPLLLVGAQAEVTPGLPNVIRSAPGRKDVSQVMGTIQAGTVMDVLDGPVCADGFYWWLVDVGGIQGWTAEGEGQTYWVVTYTPENSDAVDGWVGVIVSASEWPQIDDYFQMLDQNGNRYGITALDPTLRRELESYRDTGVLIRVWGTLYRDRMDANNTQIEVVRYEAYQG